MIPILYEANETAFTTQGLGALGDAVSLKIARVLNGKDELTMVYPNEGIRYGDLQNDRIIYAQPEYRKNAQPYQIYKITKPMNGLVTVYARHVGTQRAGFIPVLPFSDGSVVGVLNKLPQNMVESNPFTFWTNKNTVADFALTRPASLGNVLGGMEGSILDVYGGEYEFDGYTIRLWNRRGADNGVELRYAKNITDIEQSEDFASVVTGVVPYWEGMDGETVTLPEHAVYGSLAGTYPFARTIVKDFSDSFDEQPTEAQLRARATSWVEGSQLPNVSLKVNFEHLAQYTEYEGMGLLETVNLGDTVSIYYEPLSVSKSARIVNTNYDCLNEKYISVQIGSVSGNLQQVMSQISTATETIKETVTKNLPSAIETAVDNATDLITGVNGGYIVLNRDANGKPYEILIMDTDDKATATNVIRLNQNGIGFSTTGYNGPYTNAWTIDGNLVADFITTGTLNAALAKIGLLADAAGKNSWNMQTGAFTITNGTIRITTASQSYDVIQFNYTNQNGDRWISSMSSAFHSVMHIPNGSADADEQIDLGAYAIFLGRYPVSGGGSVPAAQVYKNGFVFYRNGAQDKRSELFTNVFSLFDDNATLRTKIDGNGKLWQYDANGKNRTYLEYGDIYLKNASEVTRQHLDSNGTLEQYDANGIRRTRLAWGDLYLYDDTGTMRAHVDETVGVTFYNGSGTQTALYPAEGLTYGNIGYIDYFSDATYDLDYTDQTGLYRYASAAQNTPTSAGGVLLALQFSSAYKAQVAFANSASTSDMLRIYSRRYYNGTWTPWHLISYS